jgi:hypothetical protein
VLGVEAPRVAADARAEVASARLVDQVAAQMPMP